jgi:hypothetical protein
MELLKVFVTKKSRLFFMRLMYLKAVIGSHVKEGINEQDASNTFVSVKFSRSFV